MRISESLLYRYSSSRPAGGRREVGRKKITGDEFLVMIFHDYYLLHSTLPPRTTRPELVRFVCTMYGSPAPRHVNPMVDIFSRFYNIIYLGSCVYIVCRIICVRVVDDFLRHARYRPHYYVSLVYDAGGIYKIIYSNNNNVRTKTNDYIFSGKSSEFIRFINSRDKYRHFALWISYNVAVRNNNVMYNCANNHQNLSNAFRYILLINNNVLQCFA